MAAVTRSARVLSFVDADDDGILDVCQIGIWNITVIQNGEDVTNYTTDTRCDVGFFMKIESQKSVSTRL